MKRFVAIAMGFTVLGTAQPGMTTLPQDGVVDLTAESTGAAIDAVAALIVRTVASLPPGTSAEDAEAALAYALDQSQTSPEIVVAALGALDTSGMSKAVKTALVNIRRLKLRFACNTITRKKRLADRGVGTDATGTGAVATGTVGATAVATQWQYRQAVGCESGTGALAAGQQPTFGAAPSIGGGGGTANYTSPSP